VFSLYKKIPMCGKNIPEVRPKNLAAWTTKLNMGIILTSRRVSPTQLCDMVLKKEKVSSLTGQQCQNFRFYGFKGTG
jgi:hypothetical protein